MALNIVLDPKLELSGCELNDVKRLCRRRHELSPVGWTRVAETLWVNHAGTVGVSCDKVCERSDRESPVIFADFCRCDNR